MLDFEARVLIGWLARVFANQPIRTRASKSSIFVFMLRWPTFLTASIFIIFYIIYIFERNTRKQRVFERLFTQDSMLNHKLLDDSLKSVPLYLFKVPYR